MDSPSIQTRQCYQGLVQNVHDRGSSMPPKAAAERSRSKCLRFARSSNEVAESHCELCEETILALWWSNAELSFMRKSAGDLSMLIRKVSKDGRCAVSTAYHKTKLMLQSDLETLVQLTPTTPERDLLRWCRKEDARRGLERWASKEYACERRQCIIDHVKAVVADQTGERDSGEVAESLAKVAREHSRLSRTFALYFGEADALAANIEYEKIIRRPPRIQLLPIRSYLSQIQNREGKPAT
jgi:hypothetical protein